MYRDGNHKPEMALALTPFEALVGFVAADELAAALSAVPELRAAVGEGPAAAFERAAADAASAPASPALKAALQAVFSALMRADGPTVAAQLGQLIPRLRGALDGGAELSVQERLALRLSEQYPGDVGVLCAWVLNVVRLQPGEAIYLQANVPHAYLAGEARASPLTLPSRQRSARPSPPFPHTAPLLSPCSAWS